MQIERIHLANGIPHPISKRFRDSISRESEDGRVVLLMDTYGVHVCAGPRETLIPWTNVRWIELAAEAEDLVPQPSEVTPAPQRRRK